MQKLLLIVNPFSGKGRARSALFDIVSSLCEKYLVTVCLVGGENTAESLAREYSNDYDVLVCCGGDGTLSDVANGLMRTPTPPPVGYIPMGTANDIANTLALSKDPKVAVKSVMNGVPTPLDMGSFGDKYFTYITAFGAFTGVSYSTSQAAKNTLGHLAYIFEGIASMTSIKAHHAVVEHDGGVIEGDFIFGGVTNSTSVAGLVKLDPNDVRLGDGLFEVILIKQPFGAAAITEVLSNILRQDYSSELVEFLHTSKIKFTFDEPVEWTRDGESGGAHQELEINNHKASIKIIL